MELKTKFKILAWAFVILVLLNISTIVFVILRTPKFPLRPLLPPQEQRFVEFMNQNLNLSDQQQQQVAKFRDEFMTTTHVFMDSMHFCNDNIELIMQNQSYDSAKINYFSDKQGFWHSQLKRKFVDYYFKILTILSPEQKAEFFKVYKDFRKCNMSQNEQQKKQRNRHRNGRNNF